jgi:hypothetical protein
MSASPWLDVPVIVLPPAAAEPMQADIAESIHHYFAYRAELNAREFRELMREGWASLFIGLAFLAVCMTIAQTLTAFLGKWHPVMKEGLTIIGEKTYSLDAFFRQVAFREEERCRYCYQLRLSYVARIAKKGRFDAFTTTLLYSRYQKHDLIREVAECVAGTQGIPFLYRDFREGWSEGVRVSKEAGMYRQPYCGCIYSESERYGRNPGKEAGGKPLRPRDRNLGR